MRTTKTLVAALALAVSGLAMSNLVAAPMGTAFTYQGRLGAGGQPANGSYDLRFILYNADIGGSQVGPILTNAATAVSGGIFTVTLDFGAGAFNNEARWLEIAVRTNVGGAFAPLNPRQPFTPAPQALYSDQAGTAATASSAISATTATSVPWSGITGMPAGFADGIDNGMNYTAGTGLMLTGSSFSLDTSYTDGRYWKTGGNSGTTPGTHFLGTTDNQALEIKVNSQRALRLEPNATSPNLIGGSSANSVTAGVYGAVIGGGGVGGSSHTIGANYSVIGGGYNNSIQAGAPYSAIGGGFQNVIQDDYATIAGGLLNKASAQNATVGGGDNNWASGSRSTIAGGTQHKASGYCSTIGGGYYNIAANDSATIGGGTGNFIGGTGYIFGGENATIAGGAANTNNAYCGTIGGGIVNSISTNDCSYSTIGGGQANTITLGEDSTIGGGVLNSSSGYYSTIAGGAYNSSVSFYGGTIGGGYSNSVAGDYAVVPGGILNSASGNYSFAAGRRAKANHAGAFVWGDSNSSDIASSAANQFTVRASGGVRFFSNSGSTAGVSLAAGGTSWGVISDRNAKKNFTPVNAKAVLKALAKVPVEKWNYRWEPDDSVRHIGPMAQDFKAAFYPGRDDKTITTLEFDGVALAAIQGLNEMVEEQRAELECKQTEIAELKERMERLEQLVSSQAR